MEPESSSFNPHIPRPNEHERLVAFLLDQRFFLPVAISTSLPGARGFGKTSLARAICQDPRVQEAFAEGIYWVTLGQGLSPLEMVSRIEQLIFDLTGERTVLKDVADAETRLHEMLHPRRTLLVIDDADSEEALKPFLHSGPGGACLLITHDDTRLPLDARRIPVDIMMPEESTALLLAGLTMNERLDGEEKRSQRPGLESQLPGLLPDDENIFVEPIDAASEENAPAWVVDDDSSEQQVEAVQPDEITRANLFSDQDENGEPGKPVDAGEQPDESHSPSIPSSSDEIELKELPAKIEGSVLIDASVLAEIEKEARVASAPSPEVARLTEALADRLNEWPLVLTLVNGLLRGYLETRKLDEQSLIEALQKAHALLDTEGLVPGWRIDDGPASEHALASVVAACLDLLETRTREHYLQLAVFPPGENVPQAAASILWGINNAEARVEFDRLARRGLVEIDHSSRSFRLQVALHSCIVNQLRAGELMGLNNRLLDAYQRRSPNGWASGPDDGYYFQHLAGHLIAAGRRTELQTLLFNFDWLDGFLGCTDCQSGRRADLYSLLGDYERALSSALDNQSAQLRLVQDALRLSGPVLAKDYKQLAPQLLGRLLPFDEPEIQGLVQQAEKWHDNSWLRPLAACFTPPGEDEVRVLSGHTDWVTSIALLPDGQHAVSSSLDGTLRLWDLANGQTQRVISVSQIEEEVSEIVSAVAGSPRNGTGVVNTGQLSVLPRHEHPGGVTRVVVTADGQKAITAGWDGAIRIWNLANGLEERAIAGHNEAIGALTLTPDGKFIISAGDDRLIRVWDLASGEQQFELAGHADLVRSLAVTPDGRTLVSGSWDYTLRLWDLENGALMQLMTGHEGWIQAVAVTQDGYHAISSSWDRTVRVWDLWTGETIRELTGFRAPVFSMIVAQDNRLLIAGAGDGSISLWDLITGECLRTLSGHTGGVNGLVLTSGGRFVVSASDDRTLRVWDLVAIQGGDLRPGHDAPVHALTVLPDSNHVLSASWDSTLKIWEPAAGREVRTLSAHAGGVVAMALAGDGRRVLSGSRDQTLRLWDLSSGEVILNLSGHDNPITAVAITPDASLAASGDDAGMVKVWNLTTGDCLAEFQAETSIWACVLTPDGKTVVASESGGKMFFLAIEK